MIQLILRRLVIKSPILYAVLPGQELLHVLMICKYHTSGFGFISSSKLDFESSKVNFWISYVFKDLGMLCFTPYFTPGMVDINWLTFFPDCFYIWWLNFGTFLMDLDVVYMTIIWTCAYMKPIFQNISQIPEVFVQYDCGILFYKSGYLLITFKL